MTPPAVAAPPAPRLKAKAKAAGAKPAAPARTRRPAAPPRRATAMPRGARRVSGPGAGLGAMRVHAQPAVAGGGVLTAPLGLRLARRAATVPDARFLDRLIRGRVWIVLVGAMLIGLVFLQLSLLSLNAGIGQSLEQAQGLERQNAALRTQVSRMDAGQRVQDAAARQGLVMPSAGARHYLKAGAVAPAVAVRGITPPKDPETAATTTTAAGQDAAMPAAAPPDVSPAVAAAPATAPVSPPATSTPAPVVAETPAAQTPAASAAPTATTATTATPQG